VEAPDGSELDLEMLSSGEQHELVLLYDLLFETSKNALVMIDEPELSLHVAWQDEVLKDLLEMAELSDFDVLLATHSPLIIGDRWDLTVELKGPSA
jgi:predicted ATP-binding protein involved in virulence